jgi:hypothetical protein
MEKESQIEFYLICANCEEVYMVQAHPKDSEEWARIQDQVGKTMGWCGKCMILER